jgi:hypothetical protein
VSQVVQAVVAKLADDARWSQDEMSRAFEEILAGGHSRGDICHVAPQRKKAVVRLHACFIHVKAAANFDLQGMPPQPGRSVRQRGEAAGIRRVAGGGIPLGPKQSLNMICEARRAGGSEPVSDDNIRGSAGEFGLCRHGVAVDQPGLAKHRLGAAEQGLEGAMIGTVDVFQPAFRLSRR